MRTIGTRMTMTGADIPETVRFGKTGGMSAMLAKTSDKTSSSCKRIVTS